MPQLGMEDLLVDARMNASQSAIMGRIIQLERFEKKMAKEYGMAGDIDSVAVLQKAIEEAVGASPDTQVEKVQMAEALTLLRRLRDGLRDDTIASSFQYSVEES